MKVKQRLLCVGSGLFQLFLVHQYELANQDLRQTCSQLLKKMYVTEKYAVLRHHCCFSGMSIFNQRNVSSQSCSMCTKCLNDWYWSDGQKG